jgi:hypothetical protein
MKTALSSLTAALVSGMLASVAHAGWNPPVTYPGCCPYPPPRIAPRAPDFCGQGCYSPNGYGGMTGSVYPPFPPVGGVPPTGMGGGKGGAPAFTTHPFARSPRDFFMLDY